MAIVNPSFLASSVLDTSSPRTRIRHARLDRHFGAGKWTETFVDAVLGGGTVRDGDGVSWDWWPETDRLQFIGVVKAT